MFGPGMKQNEFIQKIRDTVAEKYCNLWPHDIEKIAKEFDQEVIDSGAECVVIAGPDGHKETVLAFTYFDMNPLKTKQLFYSQRILSTLFPLNFPHFYAASGRDPKAEPKKFAPKPSGTIRQRIHTDDTIEVKYPFDSVKKICQEIGLPLQIQEGGQNFATGIDGGEYYLDSVDSLYPPNVNTEKLFAYMKENNFSENQIGLVKTSLARLEDIYKQGAIEHEKRQEEKRKQQAAKNG